MYKFKNTPATSSARAEESEFLKDVIGIANTPGLTGYLAIGLDKQGNLSHEPFANSGMRDQTVLRGLVVKYVDSPPDFELHEVEVTDGQTMKTVSVLVIPPSINKPHVIGRYASPKGNEIINYIPIRKNTGVWPASRSDIEFMYYDWKNVKPEFALDITAYNPPIAVNGHTGQITLEFQLVFRNNGRQQVAIVEARLVIEPTMEQQRTLQLPAQIAFTLDSYGEHEHPDKKCFLRHRFLTVPSERVVTFPVCFCGGSDDQQLRVLRTLRPIPFHVTAKDIDGHDYQSPRIEGRPT